jgi:hypothetical protein
LAPGRVDRLDIRRLLSCAVADPTRTRPRLERRLLMGLRPHRHRPSMTHEEEHHHAERKR